jgi:hypothetical protein
MSTEVRKAFEAMEAAESRLDRRERARRRRAGEARRAAIDDAGSYRGSLRDSRGHDVPERRAA